MKEVTGEELNAMGIRNDLSRLALENWFWKSLSLEANHFLTEKLIQLLDYLNIDKKAIPYW